jgi:hypothetical protein
MLSHRTGLRAGRLLVALGAALAPLVLAVPTALAEPCAAWPGELAPLPTPEDEDQLRARWAALRTVELAQRAERLEPTDPTEANLLWRHALCIDPSHAAALEGAARTARVRVHRPLVVRASSADSSASADPWGQLDAPIRVVPPPPPPPPPEPPVPDLARARVLEEAEQLLEETEGLVRGARFEAAIAGATELRTRLEGLADDDQLRESRVRLEVLAATAQIALGREDEARESFGRALAVRPDLELDPMKTSPKVIRVLEAARAAREGGE